MLIHFYTPLFIFFDYHVSNKTMVIWDFHSCIHSGSPLFIFFDYHVSNKTMVMWDFHCCNHSDFSYQFLLVALGTLLHLYVFILWHSISWLSSHELHIFIWFLLRRASNTKSNTLLLTYFILLGEIHVGFTIKRMSLICLIKWCDLYEFHQIRDM